MIKKSRKKNRLKTGIKLVNQIQKIRFKNNKNWMDLLKLSLQLDYRKTSKILKDIVTDDKKISNLAKKIYKLK
jgi:ribosomal protein S18|tara:strand:+ start:310 stop:528 length:219 start_codon:yes stop_codon:yes gene_type:complete